MAKYWCKNMSLEPHIQEKVTRIVDTDDERNYDCRALNLW
jgi:hypothetical protein